MRPAILRMKLAFGSRKSGRAQTPEDLLRRNQRVTIFAVARNLNVDANALCAEQFRCRPVELSRTAADEFIDQLKQMRRVVTGRTEYPAAEVV